MILDLLNKYKIYIFVFTVITVHYILNILIYLNIGFFTKETVHFLNAILQISISSFLIYRFSFAHASKSAIISNFDKEVIISSAMFMLLNVITGVLFDTYEKKIRTFLSNLFKFNNTSITSMPTIPTTSSIESIQNINENMMNTNMNTNMMNKNMMNTNITKSNDDKEEKHSIYNYLPK